MYHAFAYKIHADRFNRNHPFVCTIKSANIVLMIRGAVI